MTKLSRHEGSGDLKPLGESRAIPLWEATYLRVTVYCSF